MHFFLKVQNVLVMYFPYRFDLKAEDDNAVAQNLYVSILVF